MTITFGSVCSGIEAASVAWHPLGWRASFLSEIEPFPRSVLQHHYPDVALHGDFTTIEAGQYDSIDVLVGGTPCQSFSVAGLRRGLADARGGLTLEFARLTERLKPRWIVWENVPGVLSQDGGRAFGSFLGALAELGYGFAYRVLDAEFFGVPQRRRRVFVVGHSGGNWRRAASVLFERESLCGHTSTRRKAREGVAPTLEACVTGYGSDFICNGGVAVEGYHGHLSGTVTSKWSKGSGGPAGDETQKLVAFSCKDPGCDVGEISPTLRSMNHSGSHANAGGQVAIAFQTRGSNLSVGEVCCGWKFGKSCVRTKQQRGYA